MCTGYHSTPISILRPGYNVYRIYLLRYSIKYLYTMCTGNPSDHKFIKYLYTTCTGYPDNLSSFPKFP